MNHDQASRNGGDKDEEKGDEEMRHPRARRMRSKVRQGTRAEVEESPEVEELDTYMFLRRTEPPIEVIARGGPPRGGTRNTEVRGER